MIGDENMVGCYIGVWARNNEIFNINSIQKEKIPCGFANQLGNKGGVAIKFNYQTINMSFISSHLPAHQK
jgi:hypothetical protein